MATVIPSIGLKGLEGYKVQVEVQFLPGIEGVSIVGLPDASVKESKDRVMSALYANGCEVPIRELLLIYRRRNIERIAPFLIWQWRLGS